MRRATLIALLVAALLLSLPSAAKVMVHVKDAQGKDVGTAVLWEQAPGEVGLELKLRNLPPGMHALHFHQNAKCEAPDFKSAGPHFNPDGKKHGQLNPEGHHAGDLGNFKVGDKGTVRLRMAVKGVNLGTDIHSLFSNGGTSLVIHAKEDDLKTDPSGNASDRIACGVITK